MVSKCAGCFQLIKHREFLTCSLCKENYDLECANVSSTRFYGTMSVEHKSSWICQSCRCKTPKTGNIHKPICQHGTETNMELNDSLDQANITIRKKRDKNKSINSLNSSCLSLLGDTINNEQIQRNEEQILCTDVTTSNQLTLENIDKLIKENLKQNNMSIIAEMRKIIKNEVDIAILNLRSEIESTNETFCNKQSDLGNKIQTLDQKIVILTNEYKVLQTKTKQLQVKIEKYQQPSPSNSTHSDNSKTIVLYGLHENYWETEYELYDHVSRAMQEILNIDVSGYIEEISRIGKRSAKRPIKIELISKRMTNYILSNVQYFSNTGLSVTQYFDKETLQERRALRQALISARQQGHHAVLRKNKLFINGKETAINNNYNPSTQRNSNPDESLKQQVNDNQHNDTSLYTNKYEENLEENNLSQNFRDI